MASNNGIVEEARQLSIQERAQATDEAGGLNVLSYLVRAGEIVSPWWSKRREADLRRFWKQGDHISGAVYTLQTKIVTVPFQVLPRDMSVKSHARQAEQTEAMLQLAEYGDGWEVAIGKFVQDLLTQDNGAFLEVIGAGRPDGPIVGQPVGIAHLDSFRCTRTRSPEYPVIYEDTDGKRYKLHYTRVIARAQMPSPAAEMNGVGFCAVSRAINAAQNLMDIARYKQEKLGSRPPRQMLVGSNIGADEILSAFRIANEQMDNAGLGRYSQIVAIGSKSKEVSIAVNDLASVPDGFSEQEATMLGVAVLALAFGLDMRDLAFALGVAGQTRADAEVQHLKARTKGPGSLLNMLAQDINHKVLPSHLQLVFDQQDDEQDQLRADINKARSEAREKNLTAGAVTVRVAREQMLADGEISDSQFEQMELEAGRLPGGEPVLSLFQSPDERMRQLLDLGVADPLDVAANNRAAMRLIIDRTLHRNQGLLFSAPNGNMRRMVAQSISALEQLRSLYAPAGAEPATKELHTKQSEVEEMILTDYGEDLETLVQQAIDGEIDEETLADRLGELAAAAILLAFLLGSGASAGELSEEERALLAEEAAIHRESAESLAQSIGEYESVEAARPRLALWVGTLAGALFLGMAHRRDDPYLRWVVGPTDHCGDCARLNNQVHKASEWRASGWAPRQRNLECRGFRCQCSFQADSGPARGNF